MKNNYQRSPRYPHTSLPKVIHRLKILQVNSNIQPIEDFARRLGFVGVTGASLAILSSLRAYGLVTKTESGMQFSEAAVRLHSLKETDSAYAKLIETLAFNPPLYSDIRRVFGNEFPKGDELREYLLDQGFVPKVLSRVIETFKQTYNLVASLNPTYPLTPTGRASRIDEKTPEGHTSTREYGGMEWSFDFTDDIQICVRFAGQPSPSSIRKLRDFLNQNDLLWEDSTPE